MAKPQLKIDDEFVVIDNGKDYHFDNIPEELHLRNQWILWKYEERLDGKKPKKVPYSPSGVKVSAHDPINWLSCTDAASHYNRGGFDGIGFVFTENDPFVGIDFDKCFADGDLVPQFEWLEDWLPKFYSYTEVSPSSDGLHTIIKVKDKSKYESSYLAKKNSDGIEVYLSGRFFTITGNIYSRNGNPPTSIKHRDTTLNEFIAKFELEKKAKIGKTKAALDSNNTQPTRVKDRQVDWFGLDISQSLSVEQLKRYGQYNYKALKTIAGHRLKIKHKANSSGHKYDFPCREGGSPTTHFYDEVNNHFECLADRCDERDFFELLSVDGDLSKAFAELEKKRDENHSKAALVDDDDEVVEEKAKSKSSMDYSELLKDTLTGKAIKKPEFLIRGLVEREVPNVFVGKKKIGKSSFLQMLCAYWITGKSLNRKLFPDLDKTHRVLYFTTEDDIDTIHMRMSAMGVEDFSNFRVIEHNTAHFNLYNVHNILNIVEEFGASIIVIDPLSSYLKGGDLNNGNDVREALDPLRAKLKAYGLTPIINHHFNKIGVMANSEQIGAAARIVNEFHIDSEDPTCRLLIPTSGNDRADGGSAIRFKIVSSEDDPEIPEFKLLGKADATLDSLKDEHKDLKSVMVP